MTTLPSNLAMVGEDLARATQRDARRAIQRRRLVTYAIAFALLALTASAAIANGWLFDETPTVKAVPSFGQSAKVPKCARCSRISAPTTASSVP